MLPDQDLHHVSRVLRLKAGDRLCVSDGVSSAYQTVLVLGDAVPRARHIQSKLMAEVQSIEPILPPRVPLHLYVSRLAKSAIEEVLRRATEFGVSDVHFVDFQRSQPEGLYDTLLPRFERVCLEAVKSTGRLRVPTLHAPIAFDEMLACFSNTRATGLVFFGAISEGHDFSEWTSFETNAVHVVIGPEGDLTREEIHALIAARGVPVSLGRYVYRSEVAATMAMLFLQSRLKEL